MEVHFTPPVGRAFSLHSNHVAAWELLCSCDVLKGAGQRRTAGAFGGLTSSGLGFGSVRACAPGGGGDVADPGRTPAAFSVLNQYSMNVVVIYLVTVVSSHQVILKYLTGKNYSKHHQHLLFVGPQMTYSSTKRQRTCAQISHAFRPI